MNTPPDPTLSWLTADALVVAPQLLGWQLVSEIDGTLCTGRIVEVEAYHGTEDPASHAFRGPTPRTLPMFEMGGTIYVYLSYGIHTCMNITTGPAGEGQAVLIRALEPTAGLDTMMARRHTTALRNIANGPGKLTQALGITLALSGAQLTTRAGSLLSLTPPAAPLLPVQIIAGPRIGISQAKDQPWRFFEADSPFVSR